jgi:hypothetical protein
MKTLISLAILTALTATASAQVYGVPWFKVAGGGGTSTGSVYSVSGTIAQADARATSMAGGPFSVTGGYWAFYAVQTPGAPLLSIEELPGGVRVFWPLPATGFVLDESLALASLPPATAWSQVPVATYQTNATHISITVPMPVGSKFYRLRKP